MKKPENHDFNGIGFVVNERPIAVYGPMLRKYTHDFIKSFDVSFWHHQLRLASSVPIEEATHEHLGFLRQILSQAEEHLFALIFANLQAPKCPDLWLYRYRPSDLPEMVEKINHGDHVLNLFRLKHPTWNQVARTFWGGLSERRYELTATVIEKLACHFVSDFSRDQYNGIKHGLRLSFGGHRVSFAPGDFPTPPASESFISLGASDFGCQFYDFKTLGKSKNQYIVTRKFTNWDIEVVAFYLRHTIMLIENMGIPMRTYSDIEGDRTFRFMTDDKEYEFDPSDRDSFLEMEHHSEVEIPDSMKINLDDLRKVYT